MTFPAGPTRERRKSFPSDSHLSKKPVNPRIRILTSRSTSSSQFAFPADGKLLPPPHLPLPQQPIATLRRHSPLTLFGDRRRTGPEFVDSVLRLARGLLGLSIGSGDVVPVAAFNSDLYLEWLLAIAFVGGIVAPLNYRWSFEEALCAVEAVRPVMLVTDESCNIWSLNLQNLDLPFPEVACFLVFLCLGFLKESYVVLFPPFA